MEHCCEGTTDISSSSSITKTENPNDTCSNEKSGGTLISAQFNLLSSMIGGGSLSLPLAFYDVGIGFSGPVLVLVSSLAADFSIRMLIESCKKSGATSYEAVVEHAFGACSKYLCQAIVFSLCFITCVGYGIILRDLSSPLVHFISGSDGNSDGSPSIAENGTMLCLILLLTPLCCLKTLTALQNVGILSMASVLTMGGCVTYRSVQCNFFSDAKHFEFSQYMTWTVWSMESYLNALPLIVSVFVCHFNVLPVYLELQDKSTTNVRFLVRSTMSIACIFYITVGFWGSMYGNCLDSQKVSGNILLDFDDDDPLVLLARVCLSITVICMYPMLVNPARNILMNIFVKSTDCNIQQTVNHDDDSQSTLIQPLLDDDNYTSSTKHMHDEKNNHSPLFNLDQTCSSLTSVTIMSDDESSSTIEQKQSPKISDNANNLIPRILSAILVLWTAAFLACFIKTLDTVWDLLGSSFSILVGYFLPCSVYVAAVSQVQNRNSWKDASFIISILWICIFTPMMILCTVNSVHNAFFT